MKKDCRDISDDQIRIIGKDSVERRNTRRLLLLAIVVLMVVVASSVVWYKSCFTAGGRTSPDSGQTVVDIMGTPVALAADSCSKLAHQKDETKKAFVEIIDTLVDKVSVRLYIPHHAEMSLQTGQMDMQDSTIVYIARAADLRADNGGIVGAFVCKGIPLSWGLSKKGYCASIGGRVYVGVAQNSPLFEAATENEGYFFRQYPLVCDGRVVENRVKGKSIRRGICDRQGEIFMAESVEEVSFHDFSQALVDLGVNQAIYIVGSTSYGWSVDKEGKRHEFGVRPQQRMPETTTYLVWR